MEKIAFIPARSGSTRLKNKNILKIKNRPLIYWTVKKAILLNCFDRIIFSSDSKEYFRKLIKYLKKDNINANNIIFDNRNSKEAGTKKKIFDYIKFNLIKKFDFSNNDLIVQMLPTAPLRKNKTIIKAINLAVRKKKNIFSICKYDFHLSFAMSYNKKNWKPVFKNSPLVNGKTQSQDQKEFYRPTPVVNCLWVKNIKKKSKSIYEHAIPLEVSKIEALDIDNYEDFIKVKILFEKIF